MGDTDPETDALVWQLHRQLNDLRPRAGRAGAALTTQQSFDRARGRGRAKPAGTESGSREHSRRRRSSDGGGGGGEQQHTSAQRVKKEPNETSSSGDERPADRHDRRQQEQQQRQRQKERERQRADLSDHGQERPAKRDKQQQAGAVVPSQPQGAPAAVAAADMRQLPPPAQAAVVASEGARRRARLAGAALARDDAPSKGERPVKLFLAGMRWGVSLPCSVLRSRHELARAVNDAFVGEIVSVGRGDGLSVVFVTTDGEAEEMPAPRATGGGGGRRGGESASKWRRLVGKAARVYVRWDAAGPPGGAAVAARGGGGGAHLPAAGGGGRQALPVPHEELD